jgi:hypothetical protein
MSVDGRRIRVYAFAVSFPAAEGTLAGGKKSPVATSHHFRMNPLQLADRLFGRMTRAIQGKPRTIWFAQRLSGAALEKWNAWQRQTASVRVRFVPLRAPAVIRAQEAVYLTEDEYVIGINVDGNSRAYPLRMLGFHHLAQDRIDNTPVLVAHCPKCNSAVAFLPVVAAQERTFEVFGVRNEVLAMVDRETGTVWSHLTGTALSGPDEGVQLESIPTFQVPWSKWRELHPETGVISDNTEFHWAYVVTDAHDSASWQALSPSTMGQGIEAGGNATFFPFLNGRGESEVVPQFSLGAIHAVVFDIPGTEACAAYDATLNGRHLRFARAGDAQWRDSETQSQWNLEGAAVAGPLVGKRLRSLRTSTTRWYFWKRHYPQTGIIDS